MIRDELNGCSGLLIDRCISSPLAKQVNTLNEINVCVGLMKCRSVVYNSINIRELLLFRTGRKEGIRLVCSFLTHERLGAID